MRTTRYLPLLFSFAFALVTLPTHADYADHEDAPAFVQRMISKHVR